MGEYSFDRKWSDVMIPQIKRLVGPKLLEGRRLKTTPNKQLI